MSTVAELKYLMGTVSQRVCQKLDISQTKFDHAPGNAFGAAWETKWFRIESTSWFFCQDVFGDCEQLATNLLKLKIKAFYRLFDECCNATLP